MRAGGSKNMKTIFLVIYSGFISKNLLRTDVLRLLGNKQDVRVVLIVSKSREEEYRSLFGSEHVLVEGVESDTTTFLERLWIKFTNNVIETDTLRIQRGGGPLSPRMGLIKRLIAFLSRTTLNNSLGHALLRKIDMLFGGRQEIRALFDTYRPSLVFVANLFSVLDIEVLREAKSRSVYTVGMIKSWDNVTSKGLVRQLPNKVIVHTEIMREEMHRFADMKYEDIFVSGVPQYDMYFAPDRMSREEFFKKFSLDPYKRLILLLEPGLKLAPHGHEIWDIVEKALERKQLPEDVQVLVSIHPAYKAREDLIPRHKKLTFVRFGYRLVEGNYKTWEFSEDAAADLMRAVRHSDLVLTTFSTMNIEASIFDKPIINIAFEGYQKLPYQKSIAQYKDYTHLQPIVRSGGVKIANSKEELIAQMNELLANPAWGSAGRSDIVDKECVYRDGKSSERLVKFVLGHV